MMFKFILLLILLIVVMFPEPANAQFTETRPYKTEAGPYSLNIQSDPSRLSLGTVDYTVIITHIEDLSPISDARVLIWGSHNVNNQRGWANALNNPITPAKYTARVQLDGPGVWEMSVEVWSPLGRVAVQVPSQIIPRPRLSQAGSFVFLGVFAVLISFTIYLTWKVNRNMKARNQLNES
jgi:hypothetical protein